MYNKQVNGDDPGCSRRSQVRREALRVFPYCHGITTSGCTREVMSQHGPLQCPCLLQVCLLASTALGREVYLSVQSGRTACKPRLAALNTRRAMVGE